MKIAAVFTSTTPELTHMISGALSERFQDGETEILTYMDPEILRLTREAGAVTPEGARRLMNLYEAAAGDGAGIILNVCSSVGEVARVAEPLYAMTGVALVRIDEAMAVKAVAEASRIGVVATLSTTLEPTKRLLQDCAVRAGRKVELVDALAEGAFGLSQDAFREKLIETGSKVRSQVDALVFAQGSMAYAERAVSEALGIPVYSSVISGADAVRKTADRMKQGGMV